MSQPRPLVRLAPITANQTFRNPKILLGGTLAVLIEGAGKLSLDQAIAHK